MNTWKELCERRESIDKNRGGSSYYISTEDFDKIRRVVEAVEEIVVCPNNDLLSVGILRELKRSLEDLGVIDEKAK